MRITATASPCRKSGMISVFITNLGKYNEGELVGLVGEWRFKTGKLAHSLFGFSIEIQRC